MRRSILVLVVSGSSAMMLLQLGACGLDSGGGASAPSDATTDIGMTPDVGRPDVSSSDSGVDAPLPPADAADADAAPTCSAFTCQGQCVSTCQGCAAGTVVCLATRECGDCTTCPGAPTQCFACSGGVPTGTCQASGKSPQCASTLQGGACACPSGDAATCPGQSQICSGGGNAACASCGAGGTDNKACANGKTCDEGLGACDRDQ